MNNSFVHLCLFYSTLKYRPFIFVPFEIIQFDKIYFPDFRISSCSFSVVVVDIIIIIVVGVLVASCICSLIQFFSLSVPVLLSLYLIYFTLELISRFLYAFYSRFVNRFIETVQIIIGQLLSFANGCLTTTKAILIPIHNIKYCRSFSLARMRQYHTFFLCSCSSVFFIYSAVIEYI